MSQSQHLEVPQAWPGTSTPLSNGAVRGLILALTTINSAPGEPPRFERPSGGDSQLARYYTDDQLSAIASRLTKAAAAGKVAQLKPATAYLLARALRSYAARPKNGDILGIVCPNSKCPSHSPDFAREPGVTNCFSCMSMTNAISHLIDGDKDIEDVG